MPDYKWSPITDVSEDELASLQTTTLSDLQPLWEELKAKLKEFGLEDEFRLKLNRRWAVEAGLVENLYQWERGVTETLIDVGFNADLIPRSSSSYTPERVGAILSDQQSAIDWVFDFVKQNRPLSESYVKELHQLLTRNQPIITKRSQDGQHLDSPFTAKGVYKLQPNDPHRPDGTVHEYCPPEHVSSEMEQLIALHLEHEKRSFAAEIEAAWLHHRFSQIHPFEDGNGRVARALASLVLIRAGWMPMLVEDVDRLTYISALEKADHHDLSYLITFVGFGIQRCLQLAENVVATSRPPQATSL
jgi:hypothetical protein